MPRTAFYFIQSAMIGFMISIFPFRSRVSFNEAFEGLELGEGKLSRPVLRGPGGRKAAWLLSNLKRSPKPMPEAVSVFPTNRDAFGSSVYITFLLELRVSYFVIMIVFDASTLILITKADLLELFLARINLPVAIPGEVEKECCSSKKALDAIRIQKALDESRIEVLKLRNRRVAAKLQADFSLGKGEAEAIALALDEKAQIVAIDDKNGIDACKVLGIAFTTAVGILIRSRENGLLERPDAIAKLALLAKYGRYKLSIIEDARLRLEARP